jgi:hypothetical protein
MQQAFASGKGADHDFALAVSLAWQDMPFCRHAAAWSSDIFTKGGFFGGLGVVVIELSVYN